MLEIHDDHGCFLGLKLDGYVKLCWRREGGVGKEWRWYRKKFGLPDTTDRMHSSIANECIALIIMAVSSITGRLDSLFKGHFDSNW